MIKTNESCNYSVEQLRAAEDFLSELGEIYYSLKKLKREYNTLVASSGPEGYPTCASECGSSWRGTFSSTQVTERMCYLNEKYHALYTLLQTLQTDLAGHKHTQLYSLLYLRFKKNMTAATTAKAIGSSLRNYYRLRKRALCIICDSLSTSELGNKVLLNGSKAVLHYYFK